MSMKDYSVSVIMKCMSCDTLMYAQQGGSERVSEPLSLESTLDSKGACTGLSGANTAFVLSQLICPNCNRPAWILLRDRTNEMRRDPTLTMEPVELHEIVFDG